MTYEMTPSGFVVKNQTSNISDPEDWLIDALGNQSSSGVYMNSYRALGLPAVYASVQLIAGHLAAMDIQIRRKTANGSEEIPNHPACKLLNRWCNDIQTPMVMRETMMTHALLDGNGRAVIVRNSLGQPVELVLLYPTATWTCMNEGEKYHVVTIDSDYYRGTLPAVNRPVSSGSLYTFRDADVLHIPGLSQNGLWGYPLVQVLKNMLGIDQSGQDSAGFGFRNAGRPGLLLEAPIGVLRTQKETTEFMANFNKAHTGVDNAMRTGLLREGMKAHVLEMNAGDAQLLEQRQFSQQEIAMVFGTQQMTGEGKAVYKDLSERMQAFVTNTLGRWCAKWNDEIYRKMLSGREQSSNLVFSQFDYSKLVQGDRNTLADYTGKLRLQEIITGDEARKMHGLNGAGLDEFVTSSPTVPEVSDDEPAEDEDSQERIENKAVTFHFQNMIRTECEKLIKYAGRECNFIAEIDQLYDSQLIKMKQACLNLSLPIKLAEEHCHYSKSLVMDLAGVVTQDQLKQSITDLVKDWTTRAKEFDV